MKILMVTQEVPYLPGHDGFRLIPANLLRHLSKRHRIRVVAIPRHGQTAAQRTWAEPFCERLTLTAPHNKSLSVSPRRMFEHLEEFVSRDLQEMRPDVVHLEGPLLAPVASLSTAAPVVLSAHDSMSLRFDQFAQHASTWKMRLRYRYLSRSSRRFERQSYGRVDGVIVTSEADRLAIERACPPSRVSVVPNGVELDEYSYRRTPEPGLVVFTGNMSWLPNEDAACYFALEVLPQLRRVIRNARFAVVGANPTRRVKELAAVDGVEVTGTVADLRPWVWRASVYVSPLRLGAGVKNKIIEAMALGAPIVATSTSLTGTPLRHGAEILVADDASSLLRQTALLLTDAELQTRLSLNARRHVESVYSWSAIADKYENVYERVAHPGATVTVRTMG